jgi:hypothetical protein
MNHAISQWNSAGIDDYPCPLPTAWGEALQLGPFGSVNPEGCQAVAGGRRVLLGGRPPGNGAGVVCTPAGVRNSSLPTLIAVTIAGQVAQREGPCRRQVVAAAMSRRSGTPAGVLDHRTRFSGGRSSLTLNDHRLPATNPAGWPSPVSSAENVQTPCPLSAEWGGRGPGERNTPTLSVSWYQTVTAPAAAETIGRRRCGTQFLSESIANRVC